jgi:hypothetical protein
MSATDAGMEDVPPPSMHANPVYDPNHDDNYKGKSKDGQFCKRSTFVFLLYLPVIFAFGMCYTEMGYGASTFKGAHVCHCVLI